MKIIGITIFLCFIMFSALALKTFTINQFDNPQSFPEIGFLDSDGASHFLDEYEGSIVIVTFWASWCDICINELQKLDLLQKKFMKKPIKFIAISKDYQGMAKVKEVYQHNNIRYLEPWIDYKNTLSDQLNIINMPVSFLVNHQGEITMEFVGMVDWQNSEIQQIILDAAKYATVNYNKKPNKERAKIPDTSKNQDTSIVLDKEFNLPQEAITNIYQ